MRYIYNKSSLRGRHNICIETSITHHGHPAVYTSKCYCEIGRWQRRCLAQRGIPRLGCRLIDTRDLTDPNSEAEV